MHDIATADSNDAFNGLTHHILYLCYSISIGIETILYGDKLAMSDDGRPLNQIVVFYR